MDQPVRPGVSSIDEVDVLLPVQGVHRRLAYVGIVPWRARHVHDERDERVLGLGHVEHIVLAKEIVSVLGVLGPVRVDLLRDERRTPSRTIVDAHDVNPIQVGELCARYRIAAVVVGVAV